MDGTRVTQLTDFRMFSQVTRVILLGEEELNEPAYQASSETGRVSGENWVMVHCDDKVWALRFQDIFTRKCWWIGQYWREVLLTLKNTISILLVRAPFFRIFSDDGLYFLRFCASFLPLVVTWSRPRLWWNSGRNILEPSGWQNQMRDKWSKTPL